MSNLRLPFAVDDQERVHSPTNAEKGKAYFCPACRDSVILRKGEINTAHFAHKTTDACNDEIILHKTAKLLVKQAVHDWKAGRAPTPVLQRTCQICEVFTAQPLPEKVERAALEYEVAHGSIADVALMVQEAAAAAVQIRVPHTVEEEMAGQLPIPFIELDGNDVINNPAVWKPTIDRFRPLRCESCKSTYAKFQARLKAFAEANSLDLPKAYYRYGLWKCWKCCREMLVFTWPKQDLHDASAPKVKPVPKTIQYRHSKEIGGRYWVNTCPHCHIIQGDFFLHAEPDGSFFGVHCEEDSPAAFEKDMMHIARQALELGVL